MTNWLLTPLSDCLTKVIDYRGRTPKKLGLDWSTSGYRALSANNVKFSGLDKLDSINYADEELYKKWMKEEVCRGDLLLTSEAPSGQVMLWDSDEKIVLSQRLYALRVNSKINPKFLKYYLQSPLGQKEIYKNNSGSTVAGISAKTFSNILVSHPENISEQERIGQFLHLIDKKIDCNNLINEKLEAIAKMLYDYWFVQFDFPNANGKPYKSSGGPMVYNDILKSNIPEGWSLQMLDELGTFKNGINYDPSVQGECNAKIINVRDVSASTYFVQTDYLDDLLLSQKEIQKYLVSEESILIARSGIPGATRMVKEFSPNTIYCGFIICYTPNNSANKYAVFFRLKQLEQSLLTQSSGSILKNVSQDTLKSLSLAMPKATNSEITEKFNKLIEPVLGRISANQAENFSLNKLRDWLLPMLMNGQVTVS